MHIRIILSAFFFLWLCSQNWILSQTISWGGQLAGWTAGNLNNALISQIGLRYLPDISLKKSVTTDLLVDAEITLNTFATGNFYSENKSNLETKLKPYRVWLRFSTSRFEARLGLQKINFGPATLFRPLMWFDRIDPRDPLKMTDGVYALLLRYYFQNNANIWLWGLYDNNKNKGWEVIPAKKNSGEYGARSQIPIYRGEFGLSYHYRRLDARQANDTLPVRKDTNSLAENRFALDGKWDIGIGLWFEGVFIYKNIKMPEMRYQRYWTSGIDYTFNLGNGLYALVEYFNYAGNNKGFLEEKGVNFSALLVNYPIGLLDNVSTIWYYQWENGTLYRLVNWQRQYDNWSLYLILFWNPQNNRLNPGQSGNNIFAGKGFQLMVIFNY